MFYCLDLDYRRGLFRHDLTDVPSRVFVLFLLWHLSFFFHRRKAGPHECIQDERYFCAQDKTSDENEDLRNQITDVAQQRIPVVVFQLVTFLS